MDLQTFVAETLRQIVGGVVEAQRTIASMKTNARVNPSLIDEAAKVQSGAASPVEFDVAITVINDSQSELTGGALASSGMIAVVHASREVDERSTETHQRMTAAVSRVKFTVQVAQPSDVENYSSSFGGMSSGDRTNFNNYLV